jgi:N-sulfoglucosamine sulfohydrolase
LPLLRGKGDVERRAVFAEKAWHSYYDPMRAVRTDRFKLIRNFEMAFGVEVPSDVQRGPTFRRAVEKYSSAGRPPLELYDLLRDPHEMDNVAGSPEYERAQAELDDLLLAWVRQTSDPLLRGPVPAHVVHRAPKLIRAPTSP